MWGRATPAIGREGPGGPAQTWTSAPQESLFGTLFFFFATFALCFEAFLAAFGAVGGAFYEFDHRLFGAVALAGPEFGDARVAAVALPEAGAQGVEQLLHRSGSAQNGG